MLKKTKTAVITAIATMLSTVSPLATFAEPAEPVETIPERAVMQELHTCVDVPAVLDGESVQTTAVASTIPDRIYTCTTRPIIEVQPEEFPLERNFDVTVNVVDSQTEEHIDGVKVHLVETESLTSSVIKRDFGTWDSSESENYIIKTDHTFTDLSSLFTLTAVLEDIPEGYSLYGNTNIVDFPVDCAIDWYYDKGDYKPRTNFTIHLDKECKKNVRAICYLIDGNTGNYVEGAEVSLSEWDENGNLGNCVEWISTGKDDSINFDYTLKNNRSRSLIQFVVDKLPEKYNKYTYCPFDEKYADSNSTVLTFTVLLYEDGEEHPIPATTSATSIIHWATTTTTTTTLMYDLDWTTTTTTTPTVIGCKACDICGTVIDVNDGVTTPLGVFECPSCKSAGAGGTRPPFQTETATTNSVPTGIQTTTTTTTIMIDKVCQSCGSLASAEYGVTTSDGKFICSYCYLQGNSGEINTNGGKLFLGDANCDEKVTVADAVLIMQALSNPDKYKLSEWGELNADVYNRGDGVTPQDALTIQMIDINLISVEDLPISAE